MHIAYNNVVFSYYENHGAAARFKLDAAVDVALGNEIV